METSDPATDTSFTLAWNSVVTALQDDATHSYHGTASTSGDLSTGLTQEQGRSTAEVILTTTMAKHPTSTVRAPVTATASGPPMTSDQPSGTPVAPATATGSANVMIFAISGAAAVAVLVVIAIVLFVVWRRRRGRIGKGGSQVDPELDGDSQWTRERTREPSTTTRDSGFRDDSEPVSDLELQPRFSLDLDSINKSGDPSYDSVEVGHQIRTSSSAAVDRRKLDRETIKYDPTNNAFKLKSHADNDEGNTDSAVSAGLLGKDTRDKSETLDTDAAIEHYAKDTARDNTDTPDSDTDIEHYRKGGEQYTLVRKQSSKTAALINYELAKPFNTRDVANDDSDTSTQSDDSDSDGEEDDVYVAMNDVGDEYYVNNREVLAYEQEEEGGEDDMYTNSVEVRRYQSVIERQPEENHAPRRATSAIGMGAAKPPKPQPRLSKRKTIDPYDYLPGFSRNSAPK